MASEKPHDDNHLEPPTPEGQADPGVHDLAESSADESEDHFSDAQSELASPYPTLQPPAKDDDAELQSDTSSIKTESPAVGGNDPSDATEELQKNEDSETETETVAKSTTESEVPDQVNLQSDHDNEIEIAGNVLSERSDSHERNALETRSPKPEPSIVQENNGLEPAIEDVSLDDESRERKASVPGGFPVPITVVEEVPGELPPRSPHVQKTHSTDAAPDVVLQPVDDSSVAQPLPVTINISQDDSAASPSLEPPKSPSLSTPTSPKLRRKSSCHLQSPVGSLDPPASDDDFDDFGDFDDFEEGGGDGDSFGDFDDSEFQAPAPIVAPLPVSPAMSVTPLLPFSVPDFEGVDGDDIPEQTENYLNMLFPPETLNVPELPPLSKENTYFLTTRSASLWSQLVAPPSLAPPDWIRCRIRHLFLVSLGVPIDLDEILPASKQKKLILPFLSSPSGKSPRESTDSQAKKSGESREGTSKRRKDDMPPQLDLVSVKQLCGTTDIALQGMTEEELIAHRDKLKKLEEDVKGALTYWKKANEEKVKEKEALEAVIGDLVKHAQKVRK